MVRMRGNGAVCRTLTFLDNFVYLRKVWLMSGHKQGRKVRTDFGAGIEHP